MKKPRIVTGEMHSYPKTTKSYLQGWDKCKSFISSFRKDIGD
jgi:hypothetical protein